jgi:hypothetical protein
VYLRLKSGSGISAMPPIPYADRFIRFMSSMTNENEDTSTGQDHPLPTPPQEAIDVAATAPRPSLSPPSSPSHSHARASPTQSVDRLYHGHRDSSAGEEVHLGARAASPLAQVKSPPDSIRLARLSPSSEVHLDVQE